MPSLPHPLAQPLVERLVIVGLGLLGGSVARAARRQHAARRIVALSRPGRPHGEALQAGLIDEQTADPTIAFAGADLVVLAGPVDVIHAQLPAVLQQVPLGCLVTDVGSTKSSLVRAAEAADAPGIYVGSHPMVGSHLTGWQHSRDDLFPEGITYVTPGLRTPAEAVGRIVNFWEALGARIVVTQPGRHDELVALLSHAPHMAAVALVRLLADAREDPVFLRLLAGTGFRDTTRIAMGSPTIWREIAQHNSGPLADQLDALAGHVQELADLVRSREWEALEEALKEAAALRQSMNGE